jgi:hypothetical protein
MQITLSLLSFLFKKFNIIKKGINIKDTLKLYAVLFSCFIYKLTFVNVGSLLLADSFALFFLKFTKSCKNASKNEIYLREIYQSSNQEMFAISLSSCSRYNANFKLDQSQCSLFMTVDRHLFEISEDDHPRTVSHTRDHW